MTFREVTMHEVKEVLRQHLLGVAKRRIAERVGVDRKTVRRYVRAAEAHGVTAAEGEASLTDERLALITAELMQMPGRPRGCCSKLQTWRACQTSKVLLSLRAMIGSPR